MGPEFQQLGADEIMNFLRGEEIKTTTTAGRGRRWPLERRRQRWHAGRHQRLGRRHRRDQPLACMGFRAASSLQ